jgi:type IV pilus assembly protein PilF
MNASRLTTVLALCWLSQACVSGGADRGASQEDAAVANMNLGAGYLRQGRVDAAIEPLERAIELDPRLADAHSTIAIAYDQLGDADLAEQHYRRATTLEPGNAAAANSYAVFLCRQNRWNDAEDYFQRAADNPRYATPEAALTNAGVCARNAGDNAKAEQYFRAALARNPLFPDALSSMIDLSYREQNYLQARAFMQRYLDVRPPSAPLLWLCFNIEQELNNPAGAERCAAQLREGFPESPEVEQLQESLRRDGRG